MIERFLGSQHTYSVFQENQYQGQSFGFKYSNLAPFQSAYKEFHLLVKNEEPWLNKCNKFSPEWVKMYQINGPILGNCLINFLTQSKFKLLNATLFGSYSHGQYQIFDQWISKRDLDTL